MIVIDNRLGECDCRTVANSSHRGLLLVRLLWVENLLFPPLFESLPSGVESVHFRLPLVKLASQLHGLLAVLLVEVRQGEECFDPPYF